jgi:superfamily I DNA and/or RNA helicase
MIQAISFHQQLLQKLQLGNRNSVHLNALPHNSFRKLDLWDLSTIKENLHNEIIQEIIEKEECKFTIELKLDVSDKRNENFNLLQDIKKKLDNLYIEEQDIYKDKGFHTFALGFPTIIKRDKSNPEKLIKAPIFIFKLNIQKSNYKNNTYIISKTEDSEIIINPILLNYLEANAQLKFRHLEEQIENAETFDYPLFQSIIRQFSESLSIANENTPLHVVQAPEKNILDNLENTKDIIRYCGTFALFEIPKQPIIEEIQHVINNYDSIFKINSLEWKINNDEFKFPLISTDPSQAQILNQIENQSQIIVQGPPGTGKSRLLTSIISKALLNAKKTLVICEKLTAFEVLKENLKSINLDQHVQIIEDINEDRSAVVTKIRAQIEEQTNEVNLIDLKTNLIKAQTQLQLKFEQLNNCKKNIFTPIYNGKIYKSLVFEYLQIINDLQINNEVIASIFINRKIENETLENSLQNAEKLYYKSFESLNTFDIIKENVYEKQHFSSIFIQIQTQLAKLKTEIKNLELSLEALYQKEFQYIEQTFNTEMTFLKDNFNNICIEDKVNVEKYAETYTNFNFEQNLWQSFSSVFSSNNKKGFQAKINIKAIIDLYNTKVNAFTYCNDAINYNSRSQFELSIKQIESKFATLNSENIISTHFENNEISNLKSTEKENIKQQIQTILSNSDFEVFDISTIKNTKYNELSKNVKKILKNIAIVEQNIQEFQAVYEYKSYIKSLDKDVQTQIDFFKEKNIKQWSKLYTAKLLQEILIENDNSNRHYSIDDLNEISKLTESYAKTGIQYTQQLWHIKRKTALDNALSMQKNIKNVYTLRNSSKRKKLSLRKIVHYDLDFFTDYNPVLMLNPAVAAALLPYIYQYFDYIIFDEASQLKLEDTYSALQRAKQAIITGDSQQMPPSEYFASVNTNEDYDIEDLSQSVSLLEFAENEKFNQYYLDFHYRSKNPELIQFSNAAFYNNRLLPLPAENEEPCMFFKNVQGKYDSKSGINIEEIKAIIYTLLHEIDETKSVGIASLNIFQRDAILHAIDAAKKENKANAEKLITFENNGLFVKNLENIQGDERDIIIISTTFGIDEQLQFKQYFGPLNQAKGYKLLNVLITRAKEKIYLFNSIPEHALQNFQLMLNENGNTGKGLLYAYISYVQYCFEKNENLKNAILNQLSKNSINSNHTINNKASNFEIEKYITSHLQKAQSPYILGGLQYGLHFDNKLVDIDGELNKADNSINFELHKSKIAQLLHKNYQIIFSNRLWLYQNFESVINSAKL